MSLKANDGYGSIIAKETRDSENHKSKYAI